jgi:hypothetical protein
VYGNRESVDCLSGIRQVAVESGNRKDCSTGGTQVVLGSAKERFEKYDNNGKVLTWCKKHKKSCRTTRRIPVYGNQWQISYNSTGWQFLRAFGNITW